MDRQVTVFGGTGFLGRHVVRHLAEHGFKVRVASRHPGRGDDGRLEAVQADVHDDRSTAAALVGAYGAVNAVSLYVEREGKTFRSVHVEAAARVARLARACGAERLVHVSGVGSDATSDSPYIRSRGEGEQAVLSAFPDATIVRPAVMFGPDDGVLVPIAELLRRFPVFPLFGGGETKLQPDHVDDIAEAIVRAILAPQARVTYEFGGPVVYTYKALLETIAHRLGRRPLFVPVPFELWTGAASMAEMLPHPPITRNQVELMRKDNVPSPDAPGFAALGLAPRPIESVLSQIAPGSQSAGRHG